MAENIDWFLGRDGQQYGPIRNDEMQTLARLGQLRGSDLLWRAGLADWRPASEIFALGAADATPIAVEPEAPVEVLAEPSVSAAVPVVDRREPRAMSVVDQTSTAPPDVRADARDTISEPIARSTVARTQDAGVREAEWHTKVTTTVDPPAAAAGIETPSDRQPTAQAGTDSSTARQVPVSVANRPAVRSPNDARARRQAAGPTATRVTPGWAHTALPSKRQRRLLLATGVSIATVILGTGAYLYWDDIFGSPAAVTTSATADPPKLEKPAPPARGPAARPAFASGEVWSRVQSDFPEWFVERMREAERIRNSSTASTEGDPAVKKYLSESLVSLRRNHASDALAASHDRIRRVATAFIDNLTSLSGESKEVCYDFISHGEASDTVVRSQLSPVISAGIDAQLAAVFDAIREGRAQPVSHLPPRKSDYDVLADELVKLGWADEDLKVFSDPRLLSRASPEQVCRLVKDWFRAHLAIGDQGTQLRLLVESLRPVVAG